MQRQKVLELLKKETKHISKTQFRNAQMLADRDYRNDFWNGIEVKDTPELDNESWRLWFAYWLGREAGRATVLNNARIMLKRQEQSDEPKQGVVKTLLVASWVINP